MRPSITALVFAQAVSVEAYDAWFVIMGYLPLLGPSTYDNEVGVKSTVQT